MSEVHLFIAKPKARTMKKYSAVDSVSFIYLVGDLEFLSIAEQKKKFIQIVGFFPVIGEQNSDVVWLQPYRRYTSNRFSLIYSKAFW